jgi:hypothetical protein
MHNRDIARLFMRGLSDSESDRIEHHLPGYFSAQLSGHP